LGHQGIIKLKTGKVLTVVVVSFQMGKEIVSEKSWATKRKTNLA